MDELLAKTYQSFLETGWSRLEQNAKKAYKRKLISPTLESVMIAESMFQGQFVPGCPFDVSDKVLDELGLPILPDKALNPAHKELAKVDFSKITEKSQQQQQVEGQLVYCLLAKLFCFEARFEDSLNSLRKLGSRPAVELESLLAFESIDPDGGIASLPTNNSSFAIDNKLSTTNLNLQLSTYNFLSFQRVLAIQACYARAVSLEQLNRKYEAIQQYITITTFFRQMRGLLLIDSPVASPFFSLAMYRLGVLSCQLASQIPSQYVDEKKNQQQLLSLLKDSHVHGAVTNVQKRLLRDAATALRMFLTFQPRLIGTNRMRIALKRYMEALEGRFSRLDFRSAFDPEQFLINYTLTESKLQPFCPGSVGEDLIACSLLFEALYPRIPTDKYEAQNGGLVHPQHRVLVRRLARFNARDTLVTMMEGLIERFAAPNHSYGELMIALEAQGRLELAYITGYHYIHMGGRDQFTLLTFSKICLWFPSKLVEARELLEKILLTIDSDLKPTALMLLALAFINLSNEANSREAVDKHRHDAVIRLKLALELDPTNPKLYRLLGLTFLLLHQVDKSEEALKASIGLEEANNTSWFLLGLVKTAQKDYDACLQICNIELDTQVIPDIDLCFLKSDLLIELEQYEDAVEFLKAMFFFFIKSGQGAIPSAIDSTINRSTSMANTSLYEDEFVSQFMGDQSEQTDILRISSSEAKKDAISLETIYRQFPLSVDRIRFDTIFGDSIPSLKELSLQEILQVHRLLNTDRNSIAKRLWLKVAELHIYMNKLHDARIAAEQALQLDELCPDTHYRLGMILERQGAAGATEQLEKVLYLEPRHVPAKLALASCFVNRKSPEELALGENYAREVLLHDPYNWEAWSLYGNAVERSGRSPEAGEHYRKAIELEKFAPLGYCHRSWEIQNFPIKFF